MIHRAWFLLLPALAIPVAAARTPVEAQGTNPCRAILDSADDGRQLALAGAVQQFAWGNVRAHCEGQQTSMQTDSLNWNQGRGRFEMVGNARFRDTTVTLDADVAVYFFEDERLEAYGNVRLVNLESGTVLTGPNLTYWRAVPPLRDTTVLYAENRPTVEYRAAPDSADTEPYFIVSDHIHMSGEELAWAGGSVRIDRSDFHAEADSAELNLATDAGLLLANALVQGGNGDSSSFGLKGHDISFSSVDGALNWVQARDSAEAISDDFWIFADTVEFAVANELIQQVQAWGDKIRPITVSQLNKITADSLAIDSPDQQLDQVRGYGTARASSVLDSLDVDSDWILGDTLVAQFGNAPDSERRILQTLVALGNALAFYRVYPPNAEAGDNPDINYSRGDRITATFAESGIDKVDVVGNADGVHLEAINRGRSP